MAGFSNSSGNATSVQSIPISTTAPTNSQALVYDSATNTYVPGAQALATGQTSVNFADQSTVPATPSSSSNLVALTTAGRGLFQQQNESGNPYFLATAPWAKPYTLITPGASTAFVVSGYVPTTASQGTIVAGGVGPQGMTQNIASAASIGAQALIRTSAAFTRAQSPTTYFGGFFHYSKFYLPDASYPSTNLLSGLSSIFATDISTPRNTTTSRAAFQYSTGGGTYTDTTWQFSTANGSAQTTTDTTLTLTAGHVYECFIWCANNGLTVYWQITDVTTAVTQSGSTAATLPAVSTFLQSGSGLYTYTATARNIQIERIYTESDIG